MNVSEVGLGCSNIGRSVFNDGEAQSIDVLNRAFDHGINFFDTADSYGFGRCEELIGRIFKSRRDRIFIATKGGMLTSSLGWFGKVLFPVLTPVRSILQPWKDSLKGASKLRQDFSPSYLKKAVERSLKRLRTDYLDLYQLHNPPSQVIERGEIFETLEQLKNQGKIRYYGVSAKTVSDARQCLNFPNIASLQVAINLLEQQAIHEILPLAMKRGVAIIGRVPFARGLLTQATRIQTGREMNRGQSEALKAKVEELCFLEKNGKRSLPQASIQFILHHPGVSVVIPGTRTVRHLEENIRALEVTPLDSHELEKVSLLSHLPSSQ